MCGSSGPQTNDRNTLTITLSSPRTDQESVDQLSGLPKEKAECWTRRRTFAQVRHSSNIQLFPYSLVCRPGQPETPTPQSIRQQHRHTKEYGNSWIFELC